MNSTKIEASAGLTFMLAAKGAAPKSLGDRERIAVLSTAMGLAVRNRFPFQPEDAPALLRMGIETCVGVFRPLDENYYREACLAGGTYPRLWEQERAMKPWRAAKSVFTWPVTDFAIQVDSRVCPNVAVLMPATFSAAEPELASHEGLQVWWVTDFSNDAINLCRYKPAEGYKAQFKRPGGAPARRRKVLRADWDIFQAAMQTLAGQDVRLKWTESNDIDSFKDGWCIVPNSYRKSILRVPGMLGGFATDADALTHVRAQAAKGDALAVKGLLMHEAGLKLPERPADVPDPVGTVYVTLNV